jgi:tetratricopeptide (TPR) repeat protein
MVVMKWRSIAGFLSVLALFALLVVGCASSETAPVAKKKAKPVVRKGPGPLARAGRDLVLKDQKPSKPGALKPMTQGPGLGGGRYAQMESELSIKEQEKEYVSRALYMEGQKLVEKGQLDKAFKVLTKAWELNPKNEEARSLQTRIGALLGIRKFEADQAFTDSYDRLKVKVDEAMVEVRVLYEGGRKHYQRGEYEEAIEGFERVLNIIRWMPYHLDFSGYRETAEAFLKACYRMKRQRDLQVQRRREAMAKRLAVEEEKARNERLHGTIALLASNAHLAFTDERYEECERLCRQLLRLTRTNTWATSARSGSGPSRTSRWPSSPRSRSSPSPPTRTGARRRSGPSGSAWASTAGVPFRSRCRRSGTRSRASPSPSTSWTRPWQQS